MKNKGKKIFLILTLISLITIESCSQFCNHNSCEKKDNIVDTTSIQVIEAANRIESCLKEMDPEEIFKEDFIQGCCRSEDNNLNNEAQRLGVRILVPKCKNK